MGQRSDGFRFALEARAPIRIARHARGQHLDRDLAIETCVLGPIDLAHAAGANRGDHLIRPESGAGRHGAL